MNFLTIAITRVQRIAPPKPLPTVTKGEAHSWFSGFWHGIALGAVIGAAIAALFIKSIGA